MGSFARSPRSRSRRYAAFVVAAAVAGMAVLTTAAPRGTGPAALAADEDPLFLLMQSLANEHGTVLVMGEAIVTDKDALLDVTGRNDQVNDIFGGGYVWLPTVPDWLRDDVLSCNNPDVACPKAGSDDGAFAEGAYLFYERLAAPPGSIAATERGEWGPILALRQYQTAPIAPGEPFGGASHAVITRNDRGVKDVLYFSFVNGKFEMFATNARSFWRDNDFITLVPKAKEIQTDPVGWDVYAYSSDGTAAGTGRDTLRGLDGAPLLTFDPAPSVDFENAPAVSVAPSTSAAPSGPSGAASASAPVAESPGAGPTEPTSGIGTLWAILAILVILVVVAIVFWLLFGRRRKPTASAPAAPESPFPEPASTSEPPTPEPPVGPLGSVEPGTPDPEPVPPPIPPVAPPPPPRQCDAGDEEWREERPAQSFVVPPPGAKVHITSDPTTAALEAWLFTFGFPRGAPIPAFALLSNEDRDRMLTGLPTTPTEIDWTIEFQLDDYRLACQRRWVCDAGAWVPTDELRLLESGPDPYAGRYAVDGPELTEEDVRRIWTDARDVLVAAEAVASSMASYRAGCASDASGGAPGSAPMAPG